MANSIGGGNLIPAGMRISISKKTQPQVSQKPQEQIKRGKRTTKSRINNSNNQTDKENLSVNERFINKNKTECTEQLSNSLNNSFDENVNLRKTEEAKYSSNSSKEKVVPPVTIYKGRTMTIENSNFKYNEYCVFSVDNWDAMKCSIMDNLKSDESADLALNNQKQIENKSQINDKNCSCQDCDGFISCETWLNNNVRFENVATVPIKILPLLRDRKPEKSVEVIKKIDQNKNIVVYGTTIPSLVNRLDETTFDGSIQTTLQSIDIKVPKSIQSYAWTSIRRGLNTFLIGRSKSGKTMGYLPAICNFTLEKFGRFNVLSQYEGPLGIILCPNTEECKKLEKLINSLCEINVSVLTDSHCETNCDILIAVPKYLESSLKSQKLKLKRLCHLVLEEADLLLKNHTEIIKNLLNILDIIQRNRPHNKNIQIIATSEKWTLDLETLFKKMYATPLVCFEDYLEAALCSKIVFQKRKLNSLHKKFYLQDLLKKKYSTHRCVIFCKESDIFDINEYFETRGVECISLANNLNEDEIFENEDLWCSLKSGYYRVLLCTDTIFSKTMKITNAEWLIHFSFPSEWTQFQNRFKCVLKNLRSPWEENNVEIKSFLLIDETVNQETNFYDIVSRNCIQHFF